MPELPEVETIKNEIAPCITGKRIVRVILPDPGAVKEPQPAIFMRALKNITIQSVRRRGKYLIFTLSNNTFMVIHLRMTGSLLFDCPEDHFTRVIFLFEDGGRLAFSDRRRLGVVRLVNSVREIDDKLGPEPLDRTFTAAKLKERLRGRTAPIKAVLLDQRVVAGVGNMYADELLFMAQIHPLRKTDSLTEKEVKNMHRAMIHILKSAVAGKGASVDTYKRPDGNRGSAHEEFAVAHQMSKPCPRCGIPIQRLMIRSRGSYYCPSCQKQS
jgi:formamidopyrimidine-DNA glycosylase